MPFTLRYVPRASAVLDHLEHGDPNEQKKFRKVRKTLGLLATDPKYPGLQSAPWSGTIEGVPAGVKVWHSYVENNTPGAWRIWWYYGPGKGEISILAIGDHDSAGA